MEQVQVSARILNFPHICCCCAGSGSTGTYKASSTRTTGKRVIHTDTRSWDFPICDKCLRWMSEQNTANSDHTIFLALAFIAGALMIFGSMALPNSGGYYSVGIGVLLAVAAYFTRKGWIERQASADKLRPSSDCQLHPVIYDGWSGSVHTFHFSNQKYCAAFETANAKKVLGTRQLNTENAS